MCEISLSMFVEGLVEFISCDLCVSDGAGPQSRDHLSDLLHRPAAPEGQTHHVSGQRWSRQDHPRD